MRYSININQKMSMEWKLKFHEAVIFSAIYEAQAWAQEVIIDNQHYHFMSRTMLADEVPILALKADTIYRHMKSLQKKGLIDWRKDFKKDLVRITPKGKKWNYSESLGNKSEMPEINPSSRNEIRDNSEINPKTLGNISENSSEIFPTYKDIRIDKDTNEQDTTHTPCARETENSDLEIPQKKEKPSPAPKIQDPFPPRLMKFLEGPTAPDFFWDAFQALIEAADRKSLFIDFSSSGNAERNIEQAVRLFNLLKLHRKIPGDGTGLSVAVRRFIDTLPDWFLDKFELSLIVTKFDRIINETNAKKHKNGNTRRNYAEAAQKQKRGEKLTF